MSSWTSKLGWLCHGPVKARSSIIRFEGARTLTGREAHADGATGGQPDGPWQIRRSDWQQLLREARALKVRVLRHRLRLAIALFASLIGLAVAVPLFVGPASWRDFHTLAFMGLLALQIVLASWAIHRFGAWLPRALSHGRSDSIYDRVLVEKRGAQWIIAQGLWEVQVPSGVEPVGVDLLVTLGTVGVVVRRDPLSLIEE